MRVAYRRSVGVGRETIEWLHLYWLAQSQSSSCLKIRNDSATSSGHIENRNYFFHLKIAVLILCIILQAGQTQFMGLNRPAGRIFDTPGLEKTLDESFLLNLMLLCTSKTAERGPNFTSVGGTYKWLKEELSVPAVTSQGGDFQNWKQLEGKPTEANPLYVDWCLWMWINVISLWTESGNSRRAEWRTSARTHANTYTLPAGGRNLFNSFEMSLPQGDIRFTTS